MRRRSAMTTGGTARGSAEEFSRRQRILLRFLGIHGRSNEKERKPGQFSQRNRRGKTTRMALHSEEPLVEGANFWSATVSFPLTPALSLGERETSNSDLVTKRRCGWWMDWRTILPLPWGEGRGEGKGDGRHCERGWDAGISESRT